jgi:hypothetical protein
MSTEAEFTTTTIHSKRNLTLFGHVRNINDAKTGCVEWFDNVNRNFGNGNVKMKDGVYKEGNWTARAFHTSSIPPLEINRKLKEGKQMRDIGLPDDLFTNTGNQRWLKDQMTSCDLKGLYYRQESLVHVWDVRRVPLKPSRSNVAGNPKWVKGLAMNDLHRFHPADLMEPNIGSNQGLLDVLWTCWNNGENPWKDSKTMRMVVADSNIFKRMLKVGEVLLRECVSAGWSEARVCFGTLRNNLILILFCVFSVCL